MDQEDKLARIRELTKAKNGSAYEALLNVVVAPHPMCSGTPEHCFLSESDFPCGATCKTTSRLNRSWDGLPPGSLAGALTWAMQEIDCAWADEAAPDLYDDTDVTDATLAWLEAHK